MSESNLFSRIDSGAGKAVVTGTSLAFNVWDELKCLRDSEAWKNGATRKTLARYPEFRIDLVALKGGATIARHVNAGRISVQCVAGMIRMHTDTRDYDLPAGEVLVLDRGVWHDVEAQYDSAFLLTVALPRADVPALFDRGRWVLPPARAHAVAAAE